MLASKPSLYDMSIGRMAAVCGACRSTAALMGGDSGRSVRCIGKEEVEISKLPILHRG